MGSLIVRSALKLFATIRTHKPGVYLIVTIVTIAVSVQKQSISVIAERSPSHVHSIVPIVQKAYQIYLFGAKSKSAWNEPEL